MNPKDYSGLWQQLSIAAGVIDPSASDFVRYAPGLGRLGLYVLRTAVYAEYATQGDSRFDLGAICEDQGNTILRSTLALRRRETLRPIDVEGIRHAIDTVVPNVAINVYSSVAAYAIAHATRRDLACLFATALEDGSPTINYSSLTLPPF